MRRGLRTGVRGRLSYYTKRGWITDPKGKAKSVLLTDEGARLAQDFSGATSRPRHLHLSSRGDR